MATLSPLPKIHSTNEMPAFAAYMASKRYRYPGTVQLTDHVKLVFRKTPKRRVASNTGVHKSEFSAFLVAGEQHVGAMLVDCYTINPDNDDFYL